MFSLYFIVKVARDGGTVKISIMSGAVGAALHGVGME